MWLYNENHEKIEFLSHYKNRYITSVLSSGDKTLNFQYPIKKSVNIIEEGYIRTKTDEFVVKQTKTKGDYLEVIATLNVEELEGKIFIDFKEVHKDIKDVFNTILKDTNWSIGVCEINKKRTLSAQYKNAWELTQSAIKTYGCEIEYDTYNKIINIYEKRGSYKGVFAIDGVNMKDLEIQSTSYDFYTRLVPIGKDGLTVESINNGKNYIENHTYSNKIKTTYWKDERYTIVENLLEDAIIKLNEVSQPTKSYKMTIKDLAKLNNKYNAYEYSLGDTILMVSKEKNVKLKERIVKYIEYPDNPENNKIEVSTTKLTLEEVQKKFNDTSNTVDNLVSPDGTISGANIDIKQGSISYQNLNGPLKEKIDLLDAISSLKNKKILFIGDDFISGGNLDKNKTWCNLLALRNGMILYNYGINNVTVAFYENEEQQSLSEKINDILLEVDSADYVVFCAGHYDSDFELNIGENTDITNNTFKGALNIIFNAILAKFPLAIFLVLSPFNRKNNESNYVIALKEIANIYSIPFFNNFEELGINMSNLVQKDIYKLDDTLFLNELGHTKISYKYENLLKML